MEQTKIDNLRFSDLLSKYTSISKTKIDTYLKSNSIDNIFAHPTSITTNKSQLKKIEGLRELRNLYNRIKLQEENKHYDLNSSTKSGKYFKTYFADLKDKEQFLCTFLDNQNKVISTKIMSSGTINEAPIYARELVKEALMHDANTVIVAHNHPGGTPYPSRADMQVTKVINQAFASVGIKLLDHIIVADNNFYSFADHGKLEAAILGDFSVMETSITDKMVAAKEQAFKLNSQHSLTKEQSIR